MFGSDGDDHLAAGVGDDLLDGGAGVDQAIYYFHTVDVTVDLGAGSARFVIDGQTVNDTLVAVELVVDGQGDDLLRSGGGDDQFLLAAGGQDTVSGGIGNDTVWSGVSAETLHGGAGAGDYLSFQNSTAAGTVDLGQQTVGGASSHAVGDSIAGFEGAGGSETGDDLLRGGAGANSLRREGGNDMLSGGAGDDNLRGLANEDWLGGGADGDVFFVHARSGDNRIADFTAGEDRIAVGGFTDQTPGLTTDQWLATLTAQDTDTGLRLTDGDSFGLTLAGLTTASLAADYLLIL